MKSIFLILFFYIPTSILAQVNSSNLNTETRSEVAATVVAKINLNLAHIKYKADSIQINGIIDMLLTAKQRLEQAENTIANLAEGCSKYTKIKEEIRINRIKYKYLIDAVNNRYYTDIGFHIHDATNYEEIINLRNFIKSRRRVLILEKYIKLAQDYLNNNYYDIHRD